MSQGPVTVDEDAEEAMPRRQGGGRLVLYLPLYVNTELIQDILDGLGVERPESVEIETRRTAGRSGAAKAGAVGLGMQGERESSTERRETFTKQSRPSGLLELAIHGLRESEQLIDLTLEPDTAIPRRGIIEVTGEVEVSELSDVPALMKSFAPFIEEGLLDTEDVPPTFLHMLAGTAESGPLLLRVETDAVPLLLRGDTRWLIGGKEVEDVEGELTVLAYVERVLSPGQRVALDRYVTPGMNRAMRRQFGREGIVDLLSKVSNGMSEDSLDFVGPGLVARPIAVYP